MKRIKLYEQFVNETWKSTDNNNLLISIPKLEKVNVNKRLKTFWKNSLLSGWHEDGKNHGLVMPFQQEENFGTNTDDLYYTILDRKKLEDVKNWILAYWDIGCKDFIKKVDKSTRNDLRFSSSEYIAPRSARDESLNIMFETRDQKEPAAIKKLATHLDKDGRPYELFKSLNHRLGKLAGDCYQISTSPKEMEVICKQMGDEIRKQCDNYINGFIDINNSRTKHHNKFAKEIGHIKNKHTYVDREIIPDNPEMEKLRAKYGFYLEGPAPSLYQDNDPIADLPSSDETTTQMGINSRDRELEEKWERIRTKIKKKTNSLYLATDRPRPLEGHEFDFKYGGEANDWRRKDLGGYIYVRIDLLNSTITLIDDNEKEWNSGKLKTLNADAIINVIDDVAPYNRNHLIQK